MSTPPAGTGGRRRWYFLEERQGALVRGRLIAIAAIAVAAVAAPLDMTREDRALAVAACAVTLVAHVLLHLAALRWPRRLLAEVDAGLVLDALLVLALALLSGGADSRALWLLPPFALAATLALAPSQGIKAGALSALVVGGVIAIDGTEGAAAADWVGPLVMTAIVVIVAAGLSAVNERKLGWQTERLQTLHSASAAFAEAETPEELDTIAEHAGRLLLPGWDVTVRRDDAPAQERAWRDGDRAVLQIPVTASGGAEDPRALGVITAERAAPRPGSVRVLGEQRMALQTLAGGLAAALLRNELLQRLEQQSMADALTGLGNRRAFDESLDVELKRALRAESWVGLVMIDVDHFKMYNDRHGHQAGDDALVTVGHVIARAARAEDRACRIGGEEFALLLPGADERAAMVVAERVRRDVEGRSPAAGPITISLGVAASRGDDGGTLLSIADTRLYAAKEAGRNRVVGEATPTA